MITTIAARVPGRRVHVVADAAYHGKCLRDLPATVTWTTRLPRNAVLYQPAPAPTGKRGRPRLKGDRIGIPAQAATTTCVWHTVSVARYGRIDTVSITVLDCLWYGVFGPAPVRMVLVRDRQTGPMLALITTDLNAAPTDLVARYAARWAIEVTFFDTRQTLGVGQARNRTAQAVTRTWAFAMYVYTIVVLWYAVSGHQSQIVADRRVHAPWYLSKTDPSFADMLTALRRTLIAARFMGSRPAQPTNAESVRSSEHGHSQPHRPRKSRFHRVGRKTGVINELGAWVLETACRQAHQWRRQLPAGRRLTLHVNVSPYQLERHDVVDEVLAILRRTGFNPSDLVVEVTESAMVNDRAAIPQLAALNANGIRIALDDFGTGYSSLRYLTQLPVDILKIDRCFVAELDGTPTGSAIVTAVIRLAEILHLDTTAEGIETTAQATELTLLGCRNAQGYHFARPMDPAAIDTLLTTTTPQWSAPTS